MTTFPQLIPGLRPASGSSDPAGTEAAIVVTDLHKRYGSFRAVDGVELVIPAGQVFALLGPNGAGKTTTVEILQGFRSRDAGAVRVLGVDPASGGRRWRARIGVVPQSTGCYDDLTVREVVQHFASLYPAPLPAAQVIDMVGLSGKARARAAQLSGGQQRRLDVAVGVVGDPDLIFLDEPTTGLDPVARREAWDLVRFFADRGTTTLLTTHYLEEAQALATEAAVIVAGRVIDHGPVHDIGHAATAPTRISFTLPAGAGRADFAAWPDFSADAPPGIALFVTDRPTATLGRILDWSTRHRLGELADLQVHRPTLEDSYLSLLHAHAASSPEEQR